MADISVDSICQVLSQIAPLRLAESWDNVGLLVGDRCRHVDKVLTCLTVTPAVADEAIQQGVGLIVTHHPIPFRPLNRITCDSITGQILWRLISSKIAIYSAHTAFDSAADGINQSWADSLHLATIQPINDPTTENDLGSGRMGVLPSPMNARDVIRKCAQTVGASSPPRGVGPLDQPITKVGFACGSGGSFVSQAARRGCQLLVTGEATFHDCLQAESLGMALGLLGHFHSERDAMDRLAERLAGEFPTIKVWASENESDPIKMV